VGNPSGMEHPEQRRLRVLTEEMIRFVSVGDDESFRMLWNSLTVQDQRVVASSLMRMVARLREGDDVGGATWGIRAAQRRRA
jgi:hypothetical protein